MIATALILAWVLAVLYLGIRCMPSPKEAEKPVEKVSAGSIGIVYLSGGRPDHSQCRCNGGPFLGRGFGGGTGIRSSALRGYDYQKWILKIESENDYKYNTWHHMPFIPVEFAIGQVHQ